MKINKMMNIFTVLIICFILFNIDNILNSNLYVNNSLTLFLISFIVFTLMYGKSIYSAYKYEIFIKETEC